MSKVHTVEKIRHQREFNNETASQSELQVNTDTVDLTPLVHEYLATARALRAWRLLQRTSKLESS